MKKPLLPLLFLFFQPALADETALTKCRQIENIAERASCYDEFVDSHSRMEPSDRIEAIATSVRESANRKITVTLDNGQTWRQLDSRHMPLKSGEAVIIRKASLSSYLMEKKSGSRSIRVKRAN